MSPKILYLALMPTRLLGAGAVDVLAWFSPRRSLMYSILISVVVLFDLEVRIGPGFIAYSCAPSVNEQRFDFEVKLDVA